MASASRRATSSGPKRVSQTKISATSPQDPLERMPRTISGAFRAGEKPHRVTVSKRISVGSGFSRGRDWEIAMAGARLSVGSRDEFRLLKIHGLRGIGEVDVPRG